MESMTTSILKQFAGEASIGAIQITIDYNNLAASLQGCITSRRSSAVVQLRSSDRPRRSETNRGKNTASVRKYDVLHEMGAR